MSQRAHASWAWASIRLLLPAVDPALSSLVVLPTLFVA